MKLSELNTTQSTDGKLKLSSLQEEPQGSVADTIKGIAFGVPALAGAGYGAYKIGQPIVRGMNSIGQGIANLPKVVNVNKGTDFANQVRKAFVDTHTEQINKFGGQLDALAAKYPDKSVNLSDLVLDLKTNPDISKQTLSILNKVPKLDKLLENPNRASNVSLRDAQDITNYLQTKVPKEIRVNNFDVVDTINNIKGKQLEAFPELAGARAEYQAFIEPYKNVKQYFRFNRVLNAIKNKFGGAEGQTAVEKLLPKEVIKKMKGYRSAAKLSELPGDIPFLGRFFRSMGGALSIAPMGFQALDFSRKLEEAKKTGMFRIGSSGEIIPISKKDLAI